MLETIWLRMFHRVAKLLLLFERMYDSFCRIQFTWIDCNICDIPSFSQRDDSRMFHCDLISFLAFIVPNGQQLKNKS
jgi:hypothetical protein